MAIDPEELKVRRIKAEIDEDAKLKPIKQGKMGARSVKEPPSTCVKKPEHVSRSHLKTENK